MISYTFESIFKDSSVFCFFSSSFNFNSSRETQAPYLLYKSLQKIGLSIIYGKSKVVVNPRP